MENFHSINTIQDIQSVFPSGETDEFNWCVLSTSGVHGTYTTLDDIEEYYADPRKFEKEQNANKPWNPSVTVLIIRPRLVNMLYGHIKVEKEDIPFLRKLVNSTVIAIERSQLENLEKEGDEFCDGCEG